MSERRVRKRESDLSRPASSGLNFDIHYDPEAFGRFSESIARTLGTARFLVIQSIVVVCWIFLNLTAFAGEWDPYPFILLNLAFSTQAAYAAPLILLAQNRLAERDRAATERDRDNLQRTLADTQFLARELVSIRLALEDMVDAETLDKALDKAFDRAAERAERDAEGGS